MYSVDVKELVEKFNLTELTPNVSYEDKKITESDVNRPALQLTGFFEYFNPARLQIIGRVEHAFLQQMPQEEKITRIKNFFSYEEIPCIVLCHIDVEIMPEIIEIAEEYSVSLFKSHLSTTNFIAEVNRWLHIQVAPRVSLHGVLVDVYGEGVLIMGESGIGKSETALELIRRGHRLVSDDAVVIKRISETTLMGTSPSIIRHFMEVRGIGIVDVKQIFGVGAVKKHKQIDLVIKLELWNKEKEYDRLGLNAEYTDILGIDVVSHCIPVRPGRNIAIICEAAAVNYRQKKLGYNAADALNTRIMQNVTNRSDL
ncbi:MAG: HPr(Ser) kinase/phosphatase [Epulopiscium sp. Nele67-Bin005]|nr:MAG: HPr(Ser) kinase/phosphatase [Epulopiscium sp. Nele67-Bin005]